MTIKVSDMRCIHCQEKISKALKKAGISCTIDLESKSVQVDDSLSDSAKEAIKSAGYTPED